MSAAKKSLGKDKNDLVRVICHVIGVKDVSVLDPNTTLLDLGLDSLMAVEIKQGLEREYETVLSTQEIRELTIRDLQEIGARKQAVQITNRKESTDLTALTIHNIFTKMPTKLFVKLNTIEEKDPVFFIPPIEGELLKGCCFLWNHCGPQFVVKMNANHFSLFHLTHYSRFQADDDAARPVKQTCDWY